MSERIRTAVGKTCIMLVALCLLFCTAALADEADAGKALRYIRAYPDFFIAYRDGFLLTRDGDKILFNDQKVKEYDRLITDPSVADNVFDPEDAFHWEYPEGTPVATEENPPLGDPGRIRPLSIFRHMYGETRSQRKGLMRTVIWNGPRGTERHAIKMTTVNGVDLALERVLREIMALPEDRKEALAGIVFPASGYSGYHDRSVRGYPKRTSGHAYGIAVDINWDQDYFIGSHPKEPYRYRNNLPQFLVDIFERNGFIWGGRWHSYDAMHFEYRPELLPAHNPG